MLGRVEQEVGRTKEGTGWCDMNQVKTFKSWGVWGWHWEAAGSWRHKPVKPCMCVCVWVGAALSSGGGG